MEVGSKIALASQPQLSVCFYLLVSFSALFLGHCAHMCLVFCPYIFVCFCVCVVSDWQAFCDELETMIQDQLKKGKTPTSLLALQQIADFMTTSMPSMYPAAPQGGMAALNMSKQRRE